MRMSKTKEVKEKSSWTVDADTLIFVHTFLAFYSARQLLTILVLRGKAPHTDRFSLFCPLVVEMTA